MARFSTHERLLVILIAVIGASILILFAMPSCDSQSPTIRRDLNANVRYVGGVFYVQNNDTFGWADCDI